MVPRSSRAHTARGAGASNHPPHLYVHGGGVRGGCLPDPQHSFFLLDREGCSQVRPDLKAPVSVSITLRSQHRSHQESQTVRPDQTKEMGR